MKKVDFLFLGGWRAGVSDSREKTFSEGLLEPHCNSGVPEDSPAGQFPGKHRACPSSAETAAHLLC